jgi:tripartite-type tricarboxylate transporter receptor subunit TctC
MSATPSELAARIDQRVRAEWPGSRVSTRIEFIAPQIGAGGVTDTLLKLVRQVVEEELQRELAGTP